MGAKGPSAYVTGRSALDRRTPTLLAILGVGIVTQTILAWFYGATPGAGRDAWPVALALCLMLSLPAAGLLLAVWAARDLPFSSTMGLTLAVAGALMRAPYFGAGPMLEDDHFRYLLDGAMVAHGLSPYAHAPDALLSRSEAAPRHIVEAGRAVILAINFPELRSMYPGGAQALFALAHSIAPWNMDGLRMALFGAEALTAILVWRMLVLTGRPPLLVALYWCNPLMAFCLTGQAHVDAALALPILAALVAAHHRAAAAAGICLGIAAGVKLWPVLLAPLIARGLWPDKRALTAFALTFAAMTLALCGPLFWASLSANAGLTAYASGWSVNNAPYAWASYLFLHLVGQGSGEVLLRVLVVLAAACASLAVAARRPEGLERLIGSAAVLAATLFYLSPAQFPWYAAWFLPLAAASGSWALAAASIGLPVYYLFFPLAAAGLRDIHGYGLAFLHLAPVLLVALLTLRRTAAGASA
jgi:hypothetical protein